MIKRAVILLGFVTVFALAVFALPEVPSMKPSRLARQLPDRIEGWAGRPQEPGQKEKDILAKDTEFERMQYTSLDPSDPTIEVSLVFSGKNVSQSIHRPEVCLDAQGWEFMSEKYLAWEGLLPSGELLPVKEIICRRVYMIENEEGEIEPLLLADGKKAYLWQVFYYTFFGHDAIVSGHYQRTGEDIKDRLLKGYDQRWAYATFSTFVTKKFTDQGLSVGAWNALDEGQSQAHVVSFLKKLLPAVVSAPGEGVDVSLSEIESQK